MFDISHIDPNFKAPVIDLEGIVFYDVRKADVDFYGLYNPREEKLFCRMPFETAMGVSEWTGLLSQYTAGGQIRFQTDSPRIVLRVRQDGRKKASPHTTALLTAGFDLYLHENGVQRFMYALRPPLDKGEVWEVASSLREGKMNDVIINFPCFDGVIDLELGICEGSVLKAGGKYLPKKPIVYYGSSITHGGCACRPGNTYEAILTRRLDVPHINLGMSGNAKGEKAMADYIATLDASVFVVDYDHNSKTAETLEETHEIFVRTIREKNPDTPILMLSRARIPITEAMERATIRRRDVILKTYENLLRDGDRNVRFIDGQTIYCSDDCTVDNVHPNDLGMACMADAMEQDLRDMLFGTEN